MARIPQITGKDSVAPEHHAVVDRVVEVFGQVRGPFSILLHDPALAKLMVELVPYFRESGVIPDGLRIVAILAAVRERDTDYVWSAQVGYARRVGLREAAIDILRAKGDSAALTQDEREIVDYARSLARTNTVDQAQFDTLQRKYGTKWLVELTSAIAFYTSLCMLASAFEVPAPADGDRFRPAT